MHDRIILLTIGTGLLLGQLNADYKLVWADEFDKPGLPDPAKWSYDVGGDGWGNNELQYYTENRMENARVEDGHLVIEARKEFKWGMNYNSARLVTRDKGDWLYGRFVIRAKLPRGRGTWAAIWMLPTDWEYGGWPDSGEIDIMEHVGYDMNVVHSSLHTRHGNGMNMLHETAKITVDNVDSEFHTYVTEWTPDTIRSYVDGQLFFTSHRNDRDWTQWPFDKRFHLILNLAVGGNWGGVQGVDPDIWPQRMVVDYVRVYQMDQDATPQQPSLSLSQSSPDSISASLLIPFPGVYQLLTSNNLRDWSGASYSLQPDSASPTSASFTATSTPAHHKVYFNSPQFAFCQLRKID